MCSLSLMKTQMNFLKRNVFFFLKFIHTTVLFLFYL